MREGEPVRVVREDPERRGLLYAGTETGVYISYDAGARWQPFSGNFPVVPVTDLEVRHGDLIAATEGRSFWILDDLSTIRQHADSVVRAGVHLYTPRAAIQFSGSGGLDFGGATSGRNPPSGAVLFYRLAEKPDTATEVKVEFLDGRGRVVRSMSNREGTGAERLAPRAGVNRLLWDMRRPAPTSIGSASAGARQNVTRVLLFGAPNGGARVSPGTYQIRLSVGTTTRTQPLEIRPDPRIEATAGQVAERDSVANLLVARIGEMHDAVNRVRDIKSQVQGFVVRTKDADSAKAIATAGNAIVKKVEGLDPRLTTKAQNGQDIINYANGLNGQFGFLLGQVEGNPVLTPGAKERLQELEQLWRSLRTDVDAVEADVEAFNRLLQALGVQGVVGKKKPGVIT